MLIAGEHDLNQQGVAVHTRYDLQRELEARS
jgi:hypothetical protein